MSTHPIHIVGTGAGRSFLTSQALDLVFKAEVLFGSKRALSMFPDYSGEKVFIRSPLKETIKDIDRASRSRRVCVLVSGDPFYYSLGKSIVKALGCERVVVHPNVTVAQIAFSMLKIPWDDAGILSLHGRGMAPLMDALLKYQRLGIYTDPLNNPSMIAKFLLKMGMGATRMCVLEDIGGASQRIRWFYPEEAVGQRFREPNFVVLLVEAGGMGHYRRGHTWFSQPDALYLEEGVPITKREIRAIIISRLELMEPDLVMWDIGSGTGSVSIEASHFLPLGRIYAVEKNLKRIGIIKSNLKRFCIENVQVIEGLAPGCLNSLPSPDRVFVGGGGRRLGMIIERAAKAMKRGGKMIVSCVMLNSLGIAYSTMESLGIEFEVIGIQVNRSSKVGGGLYLRAQNPVWLLFGKLT